MQPSSLTLLLALAAASPAMAQQSMVTQVGQAPAARDAGIYHMASGTWTRAKSPIAMLGVDILYDNTCSIGSYGFISPGEVFVDAGRLPSDTSPTSAVSITGSGTSYLLDGFQIGYCTGETNIDVNVAFYQCYAACTDATVLTPDAAFTFNALPGVGGGTGSLACWVITIDLSLTSNAFNLAADCDGVYDGNTTLDNFGWSFEITTTPLSGVNQGPIIAGDPLNLLNGGAGGVGCPYGDGTTWATNGSVEGTGVGSSDEFEVDTNGVATACGFYGGYLGGGLYSSFHMRIFGDAGQGPPITGTQYCSGDGTGTPCPCGNNNDGTANGGLAGCANSVNTAGAVLDGTGNPSISNDTVVMTASGVQPNQPGVFFRADNAVNGGSGIIFGDGLRCAGGNVVRLGVVIADGTGLATSNPGAGGGLVAGDTKRYQYWYRNPAGGGACGAAFNLSNGFEIVWGS